MSENGFRLEASDWEKSCFENGSCLPAEFRRVTISLAQRVQGAVLGTLGWHSVFQDSLSGVHTLHFPRVWGLTPSFPKGLGSKPFISPGFEVFCKGLGSLWGPPHDRPENGIFPNILCKQFTGRMAAFKNQFFRVLPALASHFSPNSLLLGFSILS